MVDDAGRLWRRLRVLLRWRQHNAELSEEIALHRELRQQAFERDGMSPADAAAAANRAMGNATVMREESRHVWLMGWLESVWQDVQYGFRSMRRQPVFAAVAILGLTGGLGFSAAAFSGFYAFAMRGWNVEDPNRLVALFATSPNTPNNRYEAGFTIDQVRAFKERARALDGIIAYDRTRPDGTGSVTAAPVSAGYFRVLGVPMLRGREFLPEEDRISAPQRVMVVSHHYWTTALSSAADVIGSAVRVKGIPFTVVGVAAPEFIGTDLIGVDGWIPLAAMPIVRPHDRRSQTALTHTDACCVNVAARLAPGVSAEAAAAELTALLAQTSRPGVDTLTRAVIAQPFTVIGSSGPNVGREVVPVFLLIGGGVAVVLLLACANVANLLLARAASREREIHIRLSLGASRGRLIRQLMTESLLLALIAGIPALVIARYLPGLVLTTLTTDAVALGLSIDRTIVFFTLGLAVISCLVFGVAPALHATRAITIERRRLPLRSVFLSAQVVFCLVLLVAAGLFVRSARAERMIDLGFATDNITELTISIPADQNDSTRSARLAGELPELASTNGVQRFTYAQFSPFRTEEVAVMVPGAQVQERVPVMSAASNYPALLDMTMLSGRVFADGPAGANEIVVNALLADRLGGVNGAVGRTLLVDSVPRTVVGVLRTARDVSMRVERAAVYRPYSWSVAPRVLVRDDVEGARRLAQAIMQRDPALLVSIKPYSWYVHDAFTASTFAAAVASSLGLLALLLASVGMFGVFSYWVQQRQHDIGVRMALGATPSHVVRMVVAASARAVGWGLLIGSASALGAAQLLRASLNGISPLDPMAFGLAMVVLMASASIATLLPAWRAVRTDPLESLRAD